MSPLILPPTGPAARPLEDSIDEESINVLNARISEAGRVTLDEGSASPASLQSSTGDDSSLAASFNQRLKELSGEEQAYDAPLTGAFLHAFPFHAYNLIACMYSQLHLYVRKYAVVNSVTCLQASAAFMHVFRLGAAGAD